MRHGWCEQNTTCKYALGAAAKVADDIIIKALTMTSTDGTNGTWTSTKFSVSLQQTIGPMLLNQKRYESTWTWNS